LQEAHHFPNFNFYIKASENPEVIFGGMENSVQEADKRCLRCALENGADAFNISQMASRLIKLTSDRNSAVGPRSVAVLLPKEGFLDTNLWDNSNNGITGFMPRMIHSNGTIWGPSEFPVSLDMALQGYLPKHSLFFKSLITSRYKRRIRRLIFRRRKGGKNPGLMGHICLALYGRVPEGYCDYGFGEESSL
jgi:hypothetical protein